MSVVRLPVQHKSAPHCPKCKCDVPTFDDLIVSTRDLPIAFELIAITLHTRCVRPAPRSPKDRQVRKVRNAT
jgi:hypothetical protein